MESIQTPKPRYPALPDCRTCPLKQTTICQCSNSIERAHMIAKYIDPPCVCLEEKEFQELCDKHTPPNNFKIFIDKTK